MKTKIPLKDVIGMYTFYLNRILDGGLSTESRTVKVQGDKIYDNYSSFINSQYVTKLYHVTDTPRQMNRSVTYYLKQGLEKGILLDIVTHVEDAPIDWTAPYMKRLKSAWTTQIEKHNRRVNRNKLNDPTEFTKSRQSSTALDSWNFIAEKNSEGCRTVDTEIVALLRFPKQFSSKQIFQIERQWIENQKSLGLKITPIIKNIRPLMKDLSPIKSQSKQPIYNYYTWIDENISFAESYLPGKLDGTQVFMGRDVQTNMFVFSDLLSTDGSAMSIMVLASSGKGKSFYVKFLIESLLSTLVNVVVWDKDGEYQDLCHRQDSPVISLGKNGGKYFNTVPIMVDKNYPDAFEESMRDTVSIFDVLCNPDTGMSSNEKYLLQSAYQELLSDAGVDRNDQSTWGNTAYLDFVDLYTQLKSLSNITPDLETEYNNMIRKLSSYFEPDGLHSSLFQKSIDIMDFLHMKQGGQPILLDIVMDIQNNTDTAVTAKVIDKLKSITMSSITNRIVMYNNSRGELTALVAEEVQRHVSNESFVDTLHTVVTGGRKLNMIPILVQNSLDSTVNSPNPKLGDIVKNINTVIIGGLPDEEINLAQQYFDLTYCKPVLQKISTISDSPANSKHPWYKSFLVTVQSKKRTEMAVVKAIVPPDLRNSKSFKTRDDTV